MFSVADTCRLEVDTILDNDDNTLNVLVPKMLESAKEGFSSLTERGKDGSCCRLGKALFSWCADVFVWQTGRKPRNPRICKLEKNIH